MRTGSDRGSLVGGLMGLWVLGPSTGPSEAQAHLFARGRNATASENVDLKV